jgi:hypothetical protein
VVWPDGIVGDNLAFHGDCQTLTRDPLTTSRSHRPHEDDLEAPKHLVRDVQRHYFALPGASRATRRVQAPSIANAITPKTLAIRLLTGTGAGATVKDKESASPSSSKTSNV